MPRSAGGLPTALEQIGMCPYGVHEAASGLAATKNMRETLEKAGLHNPTQVLAHEWGVLRAVDDRHPFRPRWLAA